jgi:hypothetical protein
MEPVDGASTEPLMVCAADTGNPSYAAAGLSREGTAVN